MKKKRYLVRCCCQPEKILGSIELENVDYPCTLLIGKTITPPKFGLVNENTKITKTESVEHFAELKVFSDFPNKSVNLCVYSEDRPLEFWRQFQTFSELQQTKGVIQGDV